MAQQDIPISKALGKTVAYSSGSGTAMHSKAAHIGFVARSKAEVNSFYKAAMMAGATDDGKPSARLYYDPDITLRTFSIPTVTASRRFTRARNTADHERRTATSYPRSCGA
jgi:hypothetical protein